MRIIEVSDDLLHGGIASLKTHVVAPFLKLTGNRLLYRGIRDSNEPYLIKNCPQNRTPVDSSEGLHNFLNMCITRAKRVANRSNSLFCSGDTSIAGSYGNIHAVFPIGKFNYTWIDGVHDAYQLSHDFGATAKISMSFMKNDEFHNFGHWANNYDGYYREKNKGPLSPYNDVFNTKAILDFISKIHGDDHSLKIAIDRGNELMLHSSQQILMVHSDYFEQFGIDKYAA